MALKSILDVEVNSSNFRAFQKEYDRYQAALKRSPEAWRKIGDEIGKGRKGFKDLVDLQIAQQGKAKLTLAAQKEAARQTRTMADSWRDMQRTTKGVAGNIAHMTGNLLKWASITGVISGLVGAGGLFGIERLAQGVASGRRGALGQDVNYGTAKAFRTNYNRVVDADSILSGVNEARHSAQGRAALYGAGLTESDLRGKDTGEVSAALMQRIKKLADENSPEFYANLIKSRRLDQLGISVDDLNRARGTSQAEWDSYGASFNRDRGRMDIDKAGQKAWQDLDVQLTRAGQLIENSLIKTLTPLAPHIDRLSEVVVDVITKWGDELGPFIDKVTKYLGSDKLTQDIKDFAQGISTLAEKVSGALRYFGLVPGQSGGSSGGSTGPDGYTPEEYDSLKRGKMGDAVKGQNNLFNMRQPGKKEWQNYDSAAESVIAADKQLLRYSNRDGLNTTRGIINKWAPASDGNDTESYLKHIQQKTGYAPDQQLDMKDPQVRAELLAVMAKHETRTTLPDKKAVVDIIITNNTGGNATVSANQIAQ